MLNSFRLIHIRATNILLGAALLLAGTACSGGGNITPVGRLATIGNLPASSVSPTASAINQTVTTAQTSPTPSAGMPAALSLSQADRRTIDLTAGAGTERLANTERSTNGERSDRAGRRPDGNAHCGPDAGFHAV